MNRKTPQTAIVLILAALCIAYFTSCDSPSQPAPEQTISYEEANILEEEYKRTRSVLIDSALGYQDTREFWFSLDTVKKYIEYVEQEAKERKLKDLGLRMYFAAYPRDNQSADPGYSTIVIVPTSRGGDNVLKRGFFPLPPQDQNIDSINALNYGHGGKPPKDL